MRSVEQGCESKTLENVIYMQIERSNNFQHLISWENVFQTFKTIQISFIACLNLDSMKN